MPVGNTTNRRARFAMCLAMVRIHLPAELREMFSESPTEDALHGWHSNVNIKGLEEGWQGLISICGMG